MAARIRSLRNGIDPIDEASRTDLVAGDVVTLASLDAASTYSWVIAFAPEGSAATFSGSASSISPGSFTADLEGTYLIRLVVDAGLGTEDEQYVALRVLTAFGELTLVAAGERRDTTGTIPVDIDVEGWANDQNRNLATLKDFVKPLVSSGRILYVDANDGTDNYADFDTIQGAINAAFALTPSASSQWIIAVRPGLYVEDVTFTQFVHVIGWPGVVDGRTSDMVEIQGTHTLTTSASSDRVLIANVHLNNPTAGSTATLTKNGTGTLRLHQCQVESSAVDASQGPAIQLNGGTLTLEDSFVSQDSGNAADRWAIIQDGASTTLQLLRTEVTGPSGVDLNPGLSTSSTASIRESRITGSAGSGLGLRGEAQSLTIERSYITAGVSDPLRLHPSAGVLAGGMDVTVRWTTIDGDISFDTTGIIGASTLNTGSVEYGNTVFPGADPTETALVHDHSLFYDNTLAAILTSENVQDAIDELAAAIGGSPALKVQDYHINMPEVPNDTVYYRGWAPITAELIAVRVRMSTVNTVGNYTLTITNEATGNTVLSAASFNMNTLAAATPTTVPLTAVPADLQFTALDEWTVELTSDDPGFDGEAVYVSLVFNTVTAGGPIVEDWATTLLVGNTTSGTNPVISAGDIIEFGSSPLAPVSAAGSGRLRYNQPTTTFQVSVDGGPWENIGGGGGSPFIHKNVPPLPNNTFRYEGWTPIDAVVGDISVRMDSLNTMGNYTATFTNVTTGNTMLAAASFDMNTLVAGAVTPLTLTGTVGDLTFSAGDEWAAEFTSDDLGFDGSGIYFSILFGTTGSISITGAPDDDHQFEVTVFPNNTINTLFFAPYNCTIVGINAYCESGATTAGVYTLADEDIDATNNLLSAATFDMTTPNLPAATVTPVTLTGTTANLDLAAGTRVRFQLASDNADLVASGVYLQIIFRSQ